MIPDSSAPITIFIIEDDSLMAECISRAIKHTRLQLPTHIQIYPDAISATNALADVLPSLIILDVLLSGPDGFTFLNEIISYPDTSKIPVILITSLHLAKQSLAHYGVRTILNKETMIPVDVQKAVQEALAQTEKRYAR